MGFYNPIDFRTVMIPPVIDCTFQISAPEISNQGKANPLFKAVSPLFGRNTLIRQ